MLGARARAAEYHAFKAASARQASREAEEHKLPPKSAAVSLSAFTKNPQLNRNKGPKAWKPLVLEDTPEDDNDSLADIEDMVSTPAQQRGVDGGSSISHDSDIALMSSNLQPTWREANHLSSTVPTAPKAMLRNTSQAPSPLVNPTPRRIQPHAIIKQAQQGNYLSVNSSPSNVSGISGFPYPGLTWWFDSHGMPPLGPAAMPPFYTGQYHGNLMAPDDISPSKQENKLASLSYEHMGTSSSFILPHHPVLPVSGIVRGSMIGPMTFVRYEDEAGPSHDSHTWALASMAAERPVMQHVNSDSAVNMDGNISDTSSLLASHAIRRFSYPHAVSELMSRGSIAEPAAQQIAYHTTQPTLVLPDEEPYDRKNKMKSFVAAQQALARTGKTVLHNPDLHRVKASESSSPALSASEPTTPERTRHIQTQSPGSSEIQTPPPGFEPRLSSRRAIARCTGTTPSPLDACTLRETFEVGTDDWLELRPLSKNQRMKMSRVMKICARAQSPDAPPEMLTSAKIGRKDSLQNWMRIATRDNQPATGTRKLFELISREYLANRLSNSYGGEGALSDDMSNAEIEVAAIRAVGDIVANLSESAESLEWGVDLATFICKYKPAPEYAIERGRLLMGNTGSTSFFEEDTAGFYSAPSRIARDPRFRPATKDMVKAKSEEEWKLRLDMYGRRRM